MNSLARTSALLLPLAAIGVLTACQVSSYDDRYEGTLSDLDPIRQRYHLFYSGQCNSWLRSARTGELYCASPAIDAEKMQAAAATLMPPAPLEEKQLDFSGMSPDEAKAAMMTEGESLYGANCSACHQANGEGVTGTFPPLANSDYLTEVDVHIKTILNGQQGEITVNGVKYNGVMQAFGPLLTDAEIAAIATYERNSWGNALGTVTTEQVAALR